MCSVREVFYGYGYCRTFPQNQSVQERIFLKITLSNSVVSLKIRISRKSFTSEEQENLQLSGEKDILVFRVCLVGGIKWKRLSKMQKLYC